MDFHAYLNEFETDFEAFGHVHVEANFDEVYSEFDSKSHAWIVELKVMDVVDFIVDFDELHVNVITTYLNEPEIFFPTDPLNLFISFTCYYYN